MPDLLIAAISFSLAQVALGLALLLRQPGWGIRVSMTRNPGCRR